MGAIRVLLVDDEVEFTEALGQRLKARGFVMATAFSGDEALEKYGDEDFDVVVLDLFMPGRDGNETLREIKLRKPLTEVIMLSGKGTEETAIEGMKCGAFDFLTKPPDIGELVEKINDAYTKKAEHLVRIRMALEAGLAKGGVVQEEIAPAETAKAARTYADGVSRHGRLLVFGQGSEFSQALIEYALEMAERFSYEVLALNAAGFSKDSLRSFPSARERVCRDFRMASEENVVPFREATAKMGIPFSHVVKFSGQHDAIQEIRNEVGEVDFVVSEPTDDLIDPANGQHILVYSPS
ncbi:MAG: response regulator [Planctomycetota bacterium]|jgi:DNA-binding response OmpR family regulator